MRGKPILIFLVLCAGFLIFSSRIYLIPAQTRGAIDHGRAADGKLVWQKYNCQACHQLYGLGGYLGPDLTNVVSQPGKNQSYILAIIGSGTAQMPSFDLSREEQNALMQFLTEADRSGSADPRRFKPDAFGMIEAR